MWGSAEAGGTGAKAEEAERSGGDTQLGKERVSVARVKEGA